MPTPSTASQRDRALHRIAMRQGRAPRRRVFAAVVSGIALGNADIETCKPGDADGNNQITIDEILTVLAKALERCDAT